MDGELLKMKHGGNNKYGTGGNRKPKIMIRHLQYAKKIRRERDRVFRFLGKIVTSENESFWFESW